jgi:hypothetical protein
LSAFALLFLGYFLGSDFKPKYQLTPEMFGAVVNDNLDDSKAFQKMADSAVKVNAKCFLDYGRYILDTTIRFAKFRNGKYENFSVVIEGVGEFWDPELTIIDYRRKSGGAFDFQQSKGSRIQGIHFNGRYKVPSANIFSTPFHQYHDTSITDSRNQPYAAIRIDVVNTNLRSGSTGTFIIKCSFRDWYGAINFSPNGYTQNNEMNLVQECRGRNLKYFFSGGQDQEKTNVIRHCGTWDNIHTAFVFSPYGSGKGGNYRVYDFNMAGKCGNLIMRYSQNWGSIIFDNLITETLGGGGEWNTSMNDAIINSTINLAYPEESGFRPFLLGNGVTINQTVIRYYGRNIPILFGGNPKLFNNTMARNPILGARYLPNDSGFNKGFRLNKIRAAEVEVANGQCIVVGDYSVGEMLVFMSNTDRLLLGMGQVTQSIKGFCTVNYLPGTIRSGKYITGIYEEIKINST